MAIYEELISFYDQDQDQFIDNKLSRRELLPIIKNKYGFTDKLLNKLCDYDLIQVEPEGVYFTAWPGDTKATDICIKQFYRVFKDSNLTPDQVIRLNIDMALANY